MNVLKVASEGTVDCGNIALELILFIIIVITIY